MQADNSAIAAMNRAADLGELGRRAAWALRHVEAEAKDDVEGTLATLGPDPVYELWPLGLQIRGLDQLRRYYKHFFEVARPHIADYVVHSLCYGETSMITEITLTWRYDDGSTRNFRNATVLVYGPDGADGLAGERMYAEPEFFRLLMGPVLAELAPVAA